MSDVILFGRTQTAEQTPFDNSINGFLSDNVQGAIEETRSHFSYTEIVEFDFVFVPEGQEMVHAVDLMVRGDFMVRGSTFQIVDAVNQTGLSWTTIPSNTSVNIPVNRLLFYFNPLMVQGNLMVSGTLKEVA